MAPSRFFHDWVARAADVVSTRTHDGGRTRRAYSACRIRDSYARRNRSASVSAGVRRCPPRSTTAGRRPGRDPSEFDPRSAVAPPVRRNSPCSGACSAVVAPPPEPGLPARTVMSDSLPLAANAALPALVLPPSVIPAAGASGRKVRPRRSTAASTAPRTRPAALDPSECSTPSLSGRRLLRLLRRPAARRRTRYPAAAARSVAVATAAVVEDGRAGSSSARRPRRRPMLMICESPIREVPSSSLTFPRRDFARGVPFQPTYFAPFSTLPRCQSSMFW